MGAGGGRMCSFLGDDAPQQGAAQGRPRGEAPGAARRGQEERAEEKQHSTQLKPLYKRLFLGYDFDGDSRLNHDEFSKVYLHVLQALGLSKKQAKKEALARYQGQRRVDNLFKTYDRDQDGLISFGDFWKANTTNTLVPANPERFQRTLAYLRAFQPPPPPPKVIDPELLRVAGALTDAELASMGVTPGNPDAAPPARRKKKKRKPRRASHNPGGMAAGGRGVAGRGRRAGSDNLLGLNEGELELLEQETAGVFDDLPPEHLRAIARHESVDGRDAAAAAAMRFSEALSGDLDAGGWDDDSASASAAGGGASRDPSSAGGGMSQSTSLSSNLAQPGHLVAPGAASGDPSARAAAPGAGAAPVPAAAGGGGGRPASGSMDGSPRVPYLPPAISRLAPSVPVRKQSNILHGDDSDDSGVDDDAANALDDWFRENKRVG